MISNTSGLKNSSPFALLFIIFSHFILPIYPLPPHSYQNHQFFELSKLILHAFKASQDLSDMQNRIIILIILHWLQCLACCLSQIWQINSDLQFLSILFNFQAISLWLRCNLESKLELIRLLFIFLRQHALNSMLIQLQNL